MKTKFCLLQCLMSSYLLGGGCCSSESTVQEPPQGVERMPVVVQLTSSVKKIKTFKAVLVCVGGSPQQPLSSSLPVSPFISSSLAEQLRQLSVPHHKSVILNQEEAEQS
jgi:hypothetical protein